MGEKWCADVRAAFETIVIVGGVLVDTEADMELILGFTQEAREYLDEVEPALIELAQHDNDGVVTDPELINGVFRLFHSMKGSAGFLQLNTVASLTHEAETLLEKIRKGKTRLTHEITELLCHTLDLFHEMLNAIECSGSDTGFEQKAEHMCHLLAAASASASHNFAYSPPLAPKPEALASSLLAAAVAETPSISSDRSAQSGKSAERGPATVVAGIAINDEMRKGFYQEGNEQIDVAEQALLNIENATEEPAEALNEAFRSIHSFKGNCGFMGFADLERLSHRMETSLDHMRNDSSKVDNGGVGVLLSLIDVLRETLGSVNAGGNGNIAALDVYIQLLDEILPTEVADSFAPVEQVAPRMQENFDLPETGATLSGDNAGAVETIQKPCDDAGREEREAAQRSTERASRAVRQDIRVDLQKLDSLINLVGELVIAETMVTRSPAVIDIDDENYLRSTHQLRRICDDLQDIAMSVRMIPLSGVFRKMIRLVHDLSNKAHKKLRLNIVGEETEVDKTVIEQIGDPLVHIVRNSCDHGIEPPEERVAAGKPETGTVTVEGRHEGGEVWIIVKDDGRGLRREKILAKGIERGLVQGDGRDLPDERVFRLIFEPGFSTADSITDISGRGVGMDVVKKNIEKLNGRVDVRSTPGHGTTIILRIPLTLAIIDGMLVRVGNTKYTIPVLSIRESLRPDRKRITITPDRREVLRLRDELIPVVRIHEVFNKSCESTNLEEGILVIAEDAGASVALFVDEIVGQQQTVIKGLSEYIGKARGCSGCTILGDGSVSLILDIGTLVSMADERMTGQFSGHYETKRELAGLEAGEVLVGDEG